LEWLQGVLDDGKGKSIMISGIFNSINIVAIRGTGRHGAEFQNRNPLTELLVRPATLELPALSGIDLSCEKGTIESLNTCVGKYVNGYV